MQNCGTLQIKCNKNINFALYDFGISRVDSTSPYVWGGISVTLDTGEKSQVFEGLENGSYSWFVRKKGTTAIFKMGRELITDCGVNGDFGSNTYRMSTAKGAELAGVIQNEVLASILRLAKKQNDYMFFSENEIAVNFDNGLVISTQFNVIKIFSNFGILLQGKTVSNGSTYVDVVLNGKAELDYIIVQKVDSKLILFNPEVFSSVSNFQFFCQQSKFKDYLMDDFFKSEANNGVGNESNTTLNILPEFILSLEE